MSGVADTQGNAIYTGRVRHRRFIPLKHILEYKLRMLFLNLNSVPSLMKPSPILGIDTPALGWFRRRDYVGDPSEPLEETIRNRVERDIGFRPDGEIYLLTHLRYWGWIMNPLAIFYCYNQDNQLTALGLQVTNTPWEQKILYVLDVRTSKKKHSKVIAKNMHVSPFHPIDMDYHCQFTDPGKNLVFHMENHKDGDKYTDATIILNRSSLTRNRLIRIALFHPTDTLKVAWGIYFNALKLWLKRAPYHPPLYPPPYKPPSAHTSDPS